AVEQRGAADERRERRDAGADAGVSAVVDPALWPGDTGALACADLRLASSRLRLGAPRDVSLGRAAAVLDRRPREDCARHFVYRLDAEVPPDGSHETAFASGADWRIGSMAQLTPERFLSTPGLWVGLLFATAFLAAAVRLRRDRGPI